AADFQLAELAAASGLRAQFLPSGALFALRHHETMINQLLPGPAEDGLFRLFVRWFDGSSAPAGCAPLAGPGFAFGADDRTATWRSTPAGRALDCTTTFRLHPQKPAWAWRVQIRNTGATPQTIDLLHAQDLGLADEAAVRNNEAYASQYLDLLPLADAHLGHVILARQNQPMAGGRRPWLALACAQGAAACCTDGWQFFGSDHRLTGEPAAVRLPALPSRRLQYEFALGGLQSRPFTLAPGAAAEITFIAAYAEDHPAASSAADVAALGGDTLFTRAGWAHGRTPSTADWSAWFPGPRRQQETDGDGRLLSFFHGRDTHVVSRDKEALVARPHGHILRSGDSGWIDDRQFGLTCYAAGIFGAQSYLGNPSLARLLSVVRNHLNVARASGQRIFVRSGPDWRQLGVPSAFAMEPGAVRWIYRLTDRVIEARVWCSAGEPASFLEIKVTSGPAAEFLVTHQLALGAQEFECAGEIELHDDGWIAARPGAESLAAKHLPATAFALAAADAADLAAYGGDELLYFDGTVRHGPYAAFRTKAVAGCAFIMLGTVQGRAALPAAVARARAEYAATLPAARPPAPPLRLRGTTDAGTARLDEILPWFTHNAAIHLSAPHGLEQYGGAAWGVRDVTQGSVEWLLAAGEFATVRRILTTVFEQQYAHHPKDPAVAGCWPQWFMFPPFRFIQQTHSHGDVCFWPVKALCDYLEASNDLAFLRTETGYTAPVPPTACGRTATASSIIARRASSPAPRSSTTATATGTTPCSRPTPPCAPAWSAPGPSGSPTTPSASSPGSPARPARPPGPSASSGCSSACARILPASPCPTASWPAFSSMSPTAGCARSSTRRTGSPASATGCCP
ncbi:MAG: hypothetical protein HYV75_02025, partial [Opitutae bacterium]|nr:hypothetical protein [Opitutae bacterium]